MLTLIRGARQLLTLEGAWKKNGRHIAQEDLGIFSRAALVVLDGRVRWYGPEKKISSFLKTLPLKMQKRISEIDVGGRTLLPGWIDCHTHSVFAGNRWDEFELRCRGESYQTIASKGGGILSTMRATREVSAKKLLEISQKYVDSFFRQGVTTLEVKSGYALDLKGEIKQLQVAKQLKGPRIIATFLGAHAKPPEFSSQTEYLHFLAQQVLPLIRKKALAERVDIFVEKNFFELDAARNYLLAAQLLGFSIVVHADQLSLSGGTQLALELGALSADHVIKINLSEILKLAESETTAVLLPLADLYMKCAYPPARALIDRGARVALATDFNPGSCPSQDVQLVGLLARLQMQMTLPEVISAWTVGGAFALGLTDVGCLAPGFKADLQVVDTDWRGLFYQAGQNPTVQVFTGGLPVNL